MAEKGKQDLDLDVKPPKNNKKLIILFALLGVLLVGASVGVTIWLVGGDSDATESTRAAIEAVPTAHYMPLERMVVNFAERGPARFLQVEMELMAYDKAVFTAVERHMPVIRNDLLMLLGSVSYEQVSSREGKDALNREILETINGILREQRADDGIKAVYFTSFVMQ